MRKPLPFQFAEKGDSVKATRRKPARRVRTRNFGRQSSLPNGHANAACRLTTAVRWKTDGRATLGWEGSRRPGGRDRTDLPPPPPRGAFSQATSSQLVEITTTLGFVWFSMLLGFARLSHRSGSFGIRAARVRSVAAAFGFIRFSRRSGSFGSGDVRPGLARRNCGLGILPYFSGCDHRDLTRAELVRCRGWDSEQTRWAFYPGVCA